MEECYATPPLRQLSAHLIASLPVNNFCKYALVSTTAFSLNSEERKTFSLQVLI